MSEAPDTIIFPDGQRYRVGEVRAAHALVKHKGDWRGEPGLTAVHIPAAEPGSMFHLKIGMQSYYMKHDPAHARYICGAWPEEVATVFVIMRTDDGLLMEVRNAERMT